ncbi:MULTISPECIES: 2-oxo acid dehydrogenase subunit E2 [Streptomyces]|uniref:Dehydrogenase n=1 Tax=Streptomyces dengpaensis TaxID=2049881 RepID=A0ABN5HXI1_9ACTN|nr:MULTISPECIES: 2-oxo acid dehydrogenase subunit E2 [Streptomyces]AVH55788.1 dehydrogenase [Streptomyces dengpaensis]PIB12044.1 dehydrogenase [Streptomyces sp. HG99]
MNAVASALPRARRGTWAFLGVARRTCHVHLLADVDATALVRARAEAPHLSYISFVAKAAADAVAAHPQAGALLLGGRLHPRLAVLDDIHVKILFDRTDDDGARCVMSGTVAAAQLLSVDEIQRRVDTYKNAPLSDDGPFRAALRLQRLPAPAARLLYGLALRDPKRRAQVQGTLSVTSVGHEPVRAVLPMISGPLGFGVGRIAETAVVRDHALAVAPAFTLSLAFDHRVLDGALASQVLAQVKRRLETWEIP